METIAAILDQRLRRWEPEISEQVSERVSEIIELADQGLLDVARSRGRRPVVDSGGRDVAASVRRAPMDSQGGDAGEENAEP
jgi:hypothetical protein